MTAKYHGAVKSAGCAMVATMIALAVITASAQTATARPWMDLRFSPQQRAKLVLEQLTLDEKILLLHGEGSGEEKNLSPEVKMLRAESDGGVGFVPGIGRLGIPPIQMSDAAYGVRSSADTGRYSTALPSNLASAASWDPQAACSYGDLIGRELRAQGFDMTLGGGVNLTRDPRNGRTFEYMGEDPVLAGTLVGQRIHCEGAQHVISDIKHYAFNDQETDRSKVDARVSERAARESDLLAFQIGLKTGQPQAVMCSYNSVNGEYACENRWLLTEVLKRDWGFQGFVLSDWGATHSTEKASAAGLDQEQSGWHFYGMPLKQAVMAGRISIAELDDHVMRVLWAEFASGIVDHPPQHSVVDPQFGFDVAQRIAEQSTVLLRNERDVLPLDGARVKSIAIIGDHADTGMMSGGGSAQVDPPGTMAGGGWIRKVWFPGSPLQAVKSRAPGAKVSFVSGNDISEAVALARQSEVAVVFAWQWEHENQDLPNLSLPDGQDELVAAVAAANPRTVVVLETGSPVTMPWVDRTAAIVEAWYAGSKGADAVGNILFGTVNPSAKLPLTFPRSEADLPRPSISAAPKSAQSLTVNYDEGLKVGYKWYDAEHKAVLFPFGFGLSYTRFTYSDLKASNDGTHVSFAVTNSGKRSGFEIAEVYAALPVGVGEPPKRLIGFQKVPLQPGQSQVIELQIDPLYLSIWDEATKKWTRPAGEYHIFVGGSSAQLPLSVALALR
jgi:beta-glucosidase